MSYTERLTLHLAKNLPEEEFKEIESLIIEFGKLESERLEQLKKDNPTKIMFGKYKGTEIKDLIKTTSGKSYLKWLVKQGFLDPAMKTEIQELLEDDENAE